jgi:DNA-binding transcriptional LysR family regulator
LACACSIAPTRSVAPTQAGSRLMARLAPTLNELQAAISEVSTLRDRPAGQLRINVPRVAAQQVLAPLLGVDRLVASLSRALPVLSEPPPALRAGVEFMKAAASERANSQIRSLHTLR